MFRMIMLFMICELVPATWWVIKRSNHYSSVPWLLQTYSGRWYLPWSVNTRSLMSELPQRRGPTWQIIAWLPFLWVMVAQQMAVDHWTALLAAHQQALLGLNGQATGVLFLSARRGCATRGPWMFATDDEPWTSKRHVGYHRLKPLSWCVFIN